MYGPRSTSQPPVVQIMGGFGFIVGCGISLYSATQVLPKWKSAQLTLKHAGEIQNSALRALTKFQGAMQYVGSVTSGLKVIAAPFMYSVLFGALGLAAAAAADA